MKKFITPLLFLWGVLLLQVLAPSALQAQTYSNGGFTTGTTSKSGVAAPAGYTWSEVQNDAGVTTASNTNAGYTASTSSSFTLADDFTVAPAQSMTLNNVSFFGYQSGYAGTTSPFTALYVRIWSGQPGTAGASVLFGDLTTNRLLSSTDANSYRIFNSLYPSPMAPGTTRRIWRVTAAIAPALTLGPGTYWVEWTSTTLTSSSHFYVPVTVDGIRQTPGANALQYNGTSFVPAIDAGNPDSAPDVTVDFPFVINGLTPAPVLSSLSPTSGPVGTVVTLTGTNLTGATGVSFNGTAATTFTVVNATTITATVPAGATTGNVTVTTGSGTSNGLPFTVVNDLVVSTGTQLSPTPIAAGSYNSITITPTGNAVLSGNVSVASAFTVQPGGGFSDGCSVITGAGNFTLGAGSILGICNAAGITSSGATGSVQVTGTRSYSTLASYGYNANAAVTGNGLPGTVANLAINTAGNVTLTAPVAISVALGVGGAGNLVTGGNALTLLSNASNTALVVNTGTGTVVGNATVQRYIDPTVNAGLGYRHYSAPVAGSTVADLATAGFTPATNPSYNSSPTPNLVTPFPTVFGYDQSRVTLSNPYSPFDRGFFSPNASSDALVVGRGYAVNLPASALVDFVGTLNTGTLTQTLARNAAGTANETDAGWHLVGNPYPAPLNYSLVAAADRANLDAAIYVFSSTSQYNGAYRAYVNGVGGNPVLPVAQGFFTRVSQGQTSGTLTFRNSQRLTAPDNTSFQRNTADVRPLVQLDLRGGSGMADALYAYAEAGATPAYDAQYDAIKLPNSMGLNLSSVASSGENLAIDGRSTFTASTVLPLTVGVPAAGAYTLRAAALNNLPATLDAFLSDAATGQTVNLRLQPAYAFSVSPAEAQAAISGRFTLHFAARTALATAPGLVAAEVALYPNPAHSQFTVTVPALAGASGMQAELLNALGQVVRRHTATGTSLTVDAAGLAAGVYTLRLHVGSGTVAKRVVLQ